MVVAMLLMATPVLGVPIIGSSQSDQLTPVVRQIGGLGPVIIWASLLVLLWAANKNRGPLMKIRDVRLRNALVGFAFGVAACLWIVLPLMVGDVMEIDMLYVILLILSLPVTAVVNISSGFVEPLALIFFGIYWALIGVALGWLVEKIRGSRKK